MAVNIQERTFIRPLGAGGFADTVLFEDPDKHRFVLKTFNPKGSNDSPKALKMFIDECDRLRQVGDHPQIPSYLGFEEEEGKYAIAQEYIPGRSLREIFNEEALLTSEQSLKLLEDLLDPLEHLHRNEVVHRDIKPENIIMHRVMQKPVLVDFGAAKVATQTVLAQTQTVIGSAAYIAPEQATGNGSFHSDIYSIGVIIIEAMTGASPVATGLWSEWHSAVEGIDNRLVRIINMMVHRDLRDRFQNIAQIRREIADLHRYSQDEAEKMAREQRKKERDRELKHQKNAKLRSLIFFKLTPGIVGVCFILTGVVHAFDKLQVGDAIAGFFAPSERVEEQAKSDGGVETVDHRDPMDQLLLEMAPIALKGFIAIALLYAIGNIGMKYLKGNY